jgi:PhnB protein
MRAVVGYHSVTPYLNVDDPGAVLRFLIDVFGASERGERELGADGTIAHAEAVIGDSPLMLSQADAVYRARPSVLFVYVPDVDVTYRAAIAAGATPIREPRDQPWGDRVGGFHDPWQNRWWIATAGAGR